jgi:hypothetical protein
MATLQISLAAEKAGTEDLAQQLTVLDSGSTLPPPVQDAMRLVTDLGGMEKALRKLDLDMDALPLRAPPCLMF